MSLSLSDCSLSYNVAHQGGAVYALYKTPGTITSTVFVDNTATMEDGAGLYVDSSPFDAKMVTVSGSSFEGNASQGKGGGIATTYTAALVLSNDNAFSGNSATADPTTADVYYKDQVGREDQSR
jgi:hypothetical protein